MFSFVKRGVLASIGLLSMTRDKAHEIVDRLVERGELRREEMERAVDELVQRGEEERQALRNLVREEMTEALNALGLATKEDIENLRKDLQKLLRS